jgi:iron complex outermembrane receptor protein
MSFVQRRPIVARSFVVSGAAALLCCACGAAAQTQQAPIQLPRVVVTGNPLGSDLFEMIPPVSTLEGERLQQNRQPTLGEMLSGLPGVNSTYY